MTFRFLHTADLHLGTPFQGMSRKYPKEWAAKVRAAAHDVFQRIAQLAIIHEVDFVTIAGDLLDTDKVSMGARFALLRGFVTLKEAGIPVVMIHGNHDYFVPETSNLLHWPDNVSILGPLTKAESATEQVDSVILRVKDGRKVQISGFSYHRRDLFGSRHLAYTRHPESDFAIGLYHGAVGDASGHETYCATTVQQLVDAGFDFWGLGHIHHARVLRQQNPTIVYPGNPQGRNFREAGTKSCTLVTVTDDNAVELNFLPTGSLTWNEIEIDVSTCDDLGALVRTVVLNLEQTFPSEAQPAIVNITIHGNTGVHRLLQQDKDTLEAVAEEVCQRLPWVWIAELSDQTFPPRDREALLQSEEFIGEFLRLCQRYQEDLETLRKDAARLLEEVFHPGNTLPLANLSDEHFRHFIQAAESLVVGFDRSVEP